MYTKIHCVICLGCVGVGKWNFRSYWRMPPPPPHTHKAKLYDNCIEVYLPQIIPLYNVLMCVNSLILQNTISETASCFLAHVWMGGGGGGVTYIQFDLSYPAMSGPALIRIRDLAGYGRLNV